MNLTCLMGDAIRGSFRKKISEPETIAERIVPVTEQCVLITLLSKWI
jgi:hypothetical protein